MLPPKLLYSDGQVTLFRLGTEGPGECLLPTVPGRFWLFPCSGTVQVSGADSRLCAEVKSMGEYADVSSAPPAPAFPQVHNVYTHAYTHVYAHVCTYAYTHACAHVHAHVYALSIPVCTLLHAGLPAGAQYDMWDMREGN